jgi:hypothetical protein
MLERHAMLQGQVMEGRHAYAEHVRLHDRIHRVGH